MNIAKTKNDDLEDMTEEISLNVQQRQGCGNMRGKLEDNESRCRTYVTE